MAGLAPAIVMSGPGAVDSRIRSTRVAGRQAVRTQISPTNLAGVVARVRYKAMN